MSFSQQLTNMYYFLKEYDHDLEKIDFEKLKEYFSGLSPSDFVDAVHVAGWEIRDLPTGSSDGLVTNLISLLENIYITSVREQVSEEEGIKYNIGIANLHLYFCKRKALNNTSLLETDESVILNVEASVFHLRDATKLMHESYDIAKGIYRYQISRIFDYIFEVFENYKVDNNNIPIDLDSFYVFVDQLYSDALWFELVRQMKEKYHV